MAERRAGLRLRAAALLVIVGALAIAGWVAATGWAPSAAHYPLQGVDLGENPPAVEWPTVHAAGADFAYLVATAGADRREASFEGNWAGVAAAGMRRGAVHLYSLCQPATAQADAFNLVVPRTTDALPAALDVSFRDDCAARPAPAALIADLQRFLAMVEAHTGMPMLIGVSRGVEARYALTAAIRRPVWVMADLFPPGYSTHGWRLWRASTFRHVAGVEGTVNWDVVAP